MSVKIFHASSLTNIEKHMPILEDEINQFEKELDTQGREIKNIASGFHDTVLYIIVHYGSK